MVKRSSIVSALLVGVLMAVPAQATYTSIQANLVDLVPDTTFAGGVLTVHSTTSDALTLNDPPNNLNGTITNTVYHLETNFSHVSQDQQTGELRAIFVGGDQSLTFDYDGSPQFISGPIVGMVFRITMATPTLSTIGGEGQFSALWDLPGSNNWPAPGNSSVKSLSFAFDMDLSEYDWTSDLPDGRIESLITLTPDESAEVPAPPALLLLLPGMALIRRR